MAWLLDLLEARPKKEIREVLQVDPRTVANSCGELSLREDDLEQIRHLLSAVALAGSGKAAAIQNPERLFDFFARIAKEKAPLIQRFKPAFEQAFRGRMRAETSGKIVTIESLARELTPYEYKRNPGSALRSMGRGIARVRREHERCETLGLPSPFLDET